jgi:Domain of Unknown Function (DUF1080)
MSFSSRLLFLAALFGSLLLPEGARAQGTPNFLTAEEQAAGWKLLFDGKTITGFRGLEKPDFLHSGWTIEDGALVLPKTVDQQGKTTGGDLVTTAQFSDFEFSFEWKLMVSGASGVVYGARAGFGIKPSGYIFQIIDDVHNPDGLKGGPLKHTGALYGILPTGANEKIVETGWNTGRILVQGMHAEHWVNGEKVLEYDFGGPALLRGVRASSQRLGVGFGTKITGPIVLLDKGEGISFRSLKIRLPAALPAALATPPPAVAPARAGPTPFKSRIPIPGAPN